MPIPLGVKLVNLPKVAKAVVYGYADYAAKAKKINEQAEQKFSQTFGNSSQAADAQMVGSEIYKMKKEQGVSLRNSIRSKLGLY